MRAACLSRCSLERGLTGRCARAKRSSVEESQFQATQEMTPTMIGLFNLGGGEIVLILFLLAILVLVPAAIIGLIFLIIHLTRSPSKPSAPAQTGSVNG